MKAEDTLRVAAPAKINLYLRVIGRRPDGYHLLDSLVAFVGVHDTLVLAPADDLSLKIEGPFAASLSAQDGRDNLVLRAARQLAGAAGVKAAAEMTLIKRLPVASGIGGGSADAAAALRGLSALWAVRASAGDLHQIALGLGADVPACLAGSAAFMSGVGEGLESAGPLPAAGMLLVNPHVPVSTPEVFRRRRGDYSAPSRDTSRRLDLVRDAADLARWLAPLRNDLAAPAIEIAPAIADVLNALGGARGCHLARVSGSGATCFGLFDDLGAAERAAVEIRAAHPDWWIQPTILVDETARIKPAA